MDIPTKEDAEKYLGELADNRTTWGRLEGHLAILTVGTKAVTVLARIVGVDSTGIWIEEWHLVKEAIEKQEYDKIEHTFIPYHRIQSARIPAGRGGTVPKVRVGRKPHGL